jgi:cytochrome c-type biogenesis protein CcmH/NrfF
MIMVQRKQTALLVLIGLTSALLGLVLGYLMGFRSGLNMTREQTADLSAPQILSASPSSQALDVMFAEIVDELNCVCGCKMELRPCTCNDQKGSKEIRGFVQKLVHEGLPRPEIIKRLTEKYTEAILIKKT